MISKEFCQEMQTVGMNVPEMVEHFMDSEQMFLKYLYKFFDAADCVMLELTTAAENEDHQNMLFAAHALKGLAGNIGLNGVFLPAKKMVDDIRADDFSDCGSDFHKIQDNYYKAAAIVKKYKNLST
ncbi:MAG: Hpt domain-containing protein [Oscillospiraceae bacterium]